VPFIRQTLFAIGVWLAVYGLSGLFVEVRTTIDCLPWGAAIIAFVMPLPKRWIG
jgi:hypothetical protein